MKIAMIGAGHVGSALGEAWKKAGHLVSYVPKGEPLQSFVNGNDVLVLATPWKAAQEVVRSVGDWKGKILIDATNPLKSDMSGLETGPETSGGEMIQNWAPSAKVVKCFNQTGFENMADAKFASGKPVMFAAGNDSAAVKSVLGLAQQLGFETVALPSLTMARQLEQLAWLWIFTAFKTEVGRQFAFGLLKK